MKKLNKRIVLFLASFVVISSGFCGVLRDEKTPEKDEKNNENILEKKKDKLFSENDIQKDDDLKTIEAEDLLLSFSDYVKKAKEINVGKVEKNEILPFVETIYGLMKKDYFIDLTNLDINRKKINVLLTIFFPEKSYNQTNGTPIKFAISNSAEEKLIKVLKKFSKILKPQNDILADLEDLNDQKLDCPFDFNVFVQDFDGTKSFKDMKIVKIKCDENISSEKLLQLKDFVGLTDLNVESCSNFTDEIVGKLDFKKNFKALKTLKIYFNQGVTENTLFKIVNLKELSSLTFRNTGLKNQNSFQILPLMKKLKSLILSDINDEGLEILSEIVDLESLDLSCCDQITDAGLAHLKELKNLQVLNLSLCQKVTDAGLEHLKGLKNLQTLDLNYCNLITDAGLAHLSGLVNLNISNFNFGGNSVFDENKKEKNENVDDDRLKQLIDSNKELKDLDLKNYKKITNAGLAHLKRLVNLRKLNLSYCKQITDAGLSHLKDLVNLQTLDLYNCNLITDAGLEHLKGLKNLQTLNLQWCGTITNAGLAHLKGLVSLQTLNLRDCEKITDAGLAHLKKLKSLQTLYLSCKNMFFCKMKITDAGLAHLKDLKNLQTLDLSNCEKITDAGLAHLKGLVSLQTLNLRDCEKITDAGLASVLTNLPKLKDFSFRCKTLIIGKNSEENMKKILDWLLKNEKFYTIKKIGDKYKEGKFCEKNLHEAIKWYKASNYDANSIIYLIGYQNITDEDLKCIISEFPNLQKLDLSCCHLITDAGLAHLKGLVNLQTLNLIGDLFRKMQITDAGLKHLKGLMNLKTLDLSWCYKITDAGLSHLKGLVNLQTLYLGGCKEITDAGLEHLKGLVNLHTLDLGWCKLITDAGLSHLKSLKNLNISNFNFGGNSVFDENKKEKNENVDDDRLKQLIDSNKELKDLDLKNYKKITDAGLAHLSGLVNLQTLNLYDCNLITDVGLAHLKDLVNLQTLDLYGCGKITYAGLAHLSGLVNLQTLNLYDCNLITDDGLEHLNGLTNLQTLDLCGCNLITDDGLAHLNGLVNLKTLNLDWCKLITDAGLEHLKGLVYLQTLVLVGCNLITDDGLEHLSGLVNLKTLDLSLCEKITDAGKEMLKKAIPGLEIFVQ